MQVILQTSVVNLGEVGDVVKVNPGFARNFLLPKKMALPVTEENQKILNEKRAILEKEAAVLLAQITKQAKKMANIKLQLSVQAHETGKLFGSVGLVDIVALIKDAGYEVDKKSLHIAEGAVKSVGEYTVIVQLHAEVKFELPLLIVAENIDADVLAKRQAIDADLNSADNLSEADNS
jgi:large subunit ribosomal protein L9